ncbi:type IV pilus assembly protein PilV [Malonomonas rubra DSM 5091]|uniref:Type IV pilus assembly protein PilV n=1 Tax=Malonomonas rubra DSM 5091 TaxID=1122189 RepID=A0A1M6IKK6_MALRU|nr:prepilin-type N-terminal cleavage/methylation domain-containing protein [Malonomonas rubra]SHJ34944.1 type IV pilus assembly protein PilV [Malonomonas rubra DSM 5091]
MSNRCANDNGYTLVEVLIALTIFSVGLLAIAGLQINAIRYNSGSNLRTSTTAMAQGVMEQVMSLPSDNPLFRTAGTNVVSIDPNDSDGDGDATTLRLQGAGFFTANWVVTVDWQGITGLSRIDVNVQENSGRTITLTNFKRYNL